MHYPLVGGGSGGDGSRTATKADVDNFRAQVIAATGKNPYIVAMNFTADAAAADLVTYGLDAVGTYAVAPAPGTVQERPWSELDRNTRNSWTSFAATSHPVVPTVMTGWDTRPILPRTNSGTWYTYATPAQIATQLQAALDWVAKNPSAAAVPNVILIYAWNEISEGGWLLPSNTTFNPVGNGRLDAIGDVIGTGRQGRTMPSRRPRRLRDPRSRRALHRPVAETLS